MKIIPIVFLFAGGLLSICAHAASFSVPCLDESGQVMNAKESDVCKGILPKCAALREEIVKNVKETLSMKIWGYYNGLNLDLRTSKLSDLKGEPLPNPICSLVGHTMRFSGNAGDFEVKNQSIGKKASCGIEPGVVLKGGTAVELQYADQGGSLWIAYMQGAYPWLIRRHAYEVLKKLDKNLGNLDQVISSPGMLKDIQGTIDLAKTFTRALSSEEKKGCDQPNLVDRCRKGEISIHDPALRICTLVKSQIAANGSALPNMIISEIMDGKGGVYDHYDSVFGKILDFSNQSTDATNAKAADDTTRTMLRECSDTAGSVTTMTKNERMSETLSCLFGHEYCVSGTCHDVCFRYVDYKSGKVIAPPGIFINADFAQTSVKDRGLKVSLNRGIPGIIEKLIRHDVCGQNLATDPSVCDEVGISSKPAGVE